jgi:hypothetical protein
VLPSCLIYQGTFVFQEEKEKAQKTRKRYFEKCYVKLLIDKLEKWFEKI